METDVPKEPDLEIKMCLDVKVYAKHKPPLDCLVTEKYVNGLVDMQQVDLELTSTADTGAQVNVLGTDHLEGFGMRVDYLLRSRMELNCANAARAGTLGIFLTRIKGKHCKTGKLIETKAMVYVIERHFFII
jgi:hypothetical protein